MQGSNLKSQILLQKGSLFQSFCVHYVVTICVTRNRSYLSTGNLLANNPVTEADDPGGDHDIGEVSKLASRMNGGISSFSLGCSDGNFSENIFPSNMALFAG